MKQKIETVSFYYNELINTLHPDEGVVANYLGRAEIITDGDGFTTVEFTDLWMGTDVPAAWHSDHFHSVAVPDGSQKFYCLTKELESAALDAAESSRVVRLPDDPMPIEVHDHQIEGLAIVVVDEIQKTPSNTPTPHFLAFLRKEMNLPINP